MNKTCTSLEQSQKLIELGIDVNSADMYYREWKRDTKNIRIANVGTADESDLPCWSLAALLDVLPTGKVLLHDKGNHGYKCICNNIDSYYFSNPVDACVAMIEKLHELKIL